MSLTATVQDIPGVAVIHYYKHCCDSDLCLKGRLQLPQSDVVSSKDRCPAVTSEILCLPGSRPSLPMTTAARNHSDNTDTGILWHLFQVQTPAFYGPLSKYTWMSWCCHKGQTYGNNQWSVMNSSCKQKWSKPHHKLNVLTGCKMSISHQ